MVNHPLAQILTGSVDISLIIAEVCVVARHAFHPALRFSIIRVVRFICFDMDNSPS